MLFGSHFHQLILLSLAFANLLCEVNNTSTNASPIVIVESRLFFILQVVFYLKDSAFFRLSTYNLIFRE